MRSLIKKRLCEGDFSTAAFTTPRPFLYHYEVSSMSNSEFFHLGRGMHDDIQKREDQLVANRFGGKQKIWGRRIPDPSKDSGV
ncbi:hypothetical protein FJTKL_05851 [Diaporthe vaccinii]|uniref:Uncharacterized protein n=1 Tax=Diaporthe vaccinii TaxID=105482 RepID=A0ABR4EY43_9PEZI